MSALTSQNLISHTRHLILACLSVTLVHAATLGKEIIGIFVDAPPYFSI